MKALQIFVAISALLLASSTFAREAQKSLDEASLRGFMAGAYDVIGRTPDSNATYTGKIEIRDVGKVLRVVRTIEGVKTESQITFETLAGGDQIPVVRMSFTLGGVNYDATYRWQTDADNYPRFTGLVYRPNHKTTSPGLEAFFPIQK